MSIKVKLKTFHTEITELPYFSQNDDVNYNSQGSAMHKIIKKLVSEINKSDYVNIENKFPQKFDFEGILNEGSHINEGDIGLNLVLIDHPDVIEATNKKNRFGYFDISGSVFEEGLSNEHRAVMFIDPNPFIDLFKRYYDYVQKFVDTHEDFFREAKIFIKSHLIEIIEDLYRAKEFIERGNGFTPYELKNLQEEGVIGVSPQDILSGNGILFERDSLLKIQMDDLLDKRVKSDSRKLFYSINIDDKYYKAVIEDHQLDKYCTIDEVVLKSNFDNSQIIKNEF